MGKLLVTKKGIDIEKKESTKSLIMVAKGVLIEENRAGTYIYIGEERTES